MAVIPRPAASLVIVRDSTTGPEVLMLRRPPRGFFGDLWVFPGGAVDRADDSDVARAAVSLPDTDDGPWRAAGLRETVEEVGVALIEPRLSPMAFDGSSTNVFGRILAASQRLDGVSLTPISRWITPELAPTRFDARFFLAVVDGDPPLRPELSEVVETTWINVREAADRADTGVWSVVLPTKHHLDWLAGFDDIGSISNAAGQLTVRPVQPIVATDGSIVRSPLPIGVDAS